MSTNPDGSGQPVSALIGLGGNVGDVIGSMQSALDQLAADEACAVVAVSAVYKTPPWGIEDQDWFLNACAEIQTTLAPEDLLELLLEIERSAKRVRDVRWGPRTLDLDILVYGDVQMDSDRLKLPHPRMTERSFVMVPLNDIAADRMIAGRMVSDYAKALARDGIEKTDFELTISRPR